MEIKIDKKIIEQVLIEDCLMKYHSGYDYKIVFLFYALENSWHVNKLIYYVGLIEDRNV